MRLRLILLLTFSITSCENREVKYSGLNELVVGVQQVILYKNGEFYLELGAGGTEGTYKIENDTVFLKYSNKPENWPDKLLITDNYFVTISKKDISTPIRIRR